MARPVDVVAVMRKAYDTVRLYSFPQYAQDVKAARELIAQLACYAILALMLAALWWAPEIVEATPWLRD